jgi:hypothetical protein
VSVCTLSSAFKLLILSILSCVADAVTDLANQGIIHLASLHVTKERCVGVLTKCDMLRDDEEVSSTTLLKRSSAYKFAKDVEQGRRHCNRPGSSYHKARM